MSRRQQIRWETSSLLLEACGEMDWFILLTSPQKEQTAQLLLRNRGYTTYLPVEHKFRKANKFAKRKIKTYPAMRGYLFIGFAPGEHTWYDVFQTYHVKGVLAAQEEPYRLVGDQVGVMVRKYADGLQRPSVERYMRTGKEFNVGDTVRIAEGAFEGWKLPVVEIRGGYASMLGNILGSDQTIRVPLDICEKEDA